MDTPRDILKRYTILSLSHLFSILAPLIIFPLMVSRIGSVEFGKIIFIQTLVAYFAVFIDYDFNLWGIREIAKGKNENFIRGEVISSKLVLFLFASVLYLITGALLFSKIKNISFLLSGLLILLSYSLNPIWYFQALEKIWAFAWINVFSKIFFFAGVFFLVEESRDGWAYNLFMSLGLIIPGLILFFNNIFFKGVKVNLKRGWDIFISNISILGYSNSSVIWISIFLPMSSVTQFSVGERIVFAARGFFSLYAQIIYPKICKSDNAESRASILKTHYGMVIFSFFGGAIICLFAELITSIFIKNHDAEVVMLVRQMAFLPTIIAANIYPYQWLLAHSHYSITRNILIIGAILGTLLFPISISFYGLHGAVWASFIVESCITVSLIFYFFKFKEQHVPA